MIKKKSEKYKQQVIGGRRYKQQKRKNFQIDVNSKEQKLTVFNLITSALHINLEHLVQIYTLTSSDTALFSVLVLISAFHNMSS